jgi:glycerophosphodiester phosphodiesterase
LQTKEGIDAVIVDSVLAIRKGLTGTDVGPNLEPFAGLVGPPNTDGATTPNGTVVKDPVNGVPIFNHGGVDALHGAIFSG